MALHSFGSPFLPCSTRSVRLWRPRCYRSFWSSKVWYSSGIKRFPRAFDGGSRRGFCTQLYNLFYFADTSAYTALTAQIEKDVAFDNRQIPTFQGIRCLVFFIVLRSLVSGSRCLDLVLCVLPANQPALFLLRMKGVRKYVSGLQLSHCFIPAAHNCCSSTWLLAGAVRYPYQRSLAY